MKTFRNNKYGEGSISKRIKPSDFKQMMIIKLQHMLFIQDVKFFHRTLQNLCQDSEQPKKFSL